METRLGRTLNRLRFSLTGFRAFLLPALLLNLFLCVCLFAQTANLPLPYPIPPPAEDPPPAQRPSVSTPATTQSAQKKPTTATAQPSAATVQTSTASAQTSAATPVRIYVSSKPLRDISGNVIPMNGAYGGPTILLPISYAAKQDEFRGVWVATSFNLDFAKQATAAEFQQSFRTLAASLAARGFNTIMFQVRPNCDAFYMSSTIRGRAG